MTSISNAIVKREAWKLLQSPNFKYNLFIFGNPFESRDTDHSVPGARPLFCRWGSPPVTRKPGNGWGQAGIFDQRKPISSNLFQMLPAAPNATVKQLGSCTRRCISPFKKFSSTIEIRRQKNITRNFYGFKHTFMNSRTNSPAWAGTLWRSPHWRNLHPVEARDDPCLTHATRGTTLLTQHQNWEESRRRRREHTFYVTKLPKL